VCILKVINTKLLSKISKDSEIPTPTRSKTAQSDKKLNFAGEISATRSHIVMMEIINHK